MTPRGSGVSRSSSLSRIADALDHPNMNLKKAAAETPRTAGAPAVVPKLLFWLGHHDNPGLREVKALHAHGWDDATARALAARAMTDPLENEEIAVVRRFLPEWMELAAATVGPARSGARWMIVWIGAKPLTVEEVKLFAGRLPILLEGLDDATEGLQAGLLDLLEVLAPALARIEKKTSGGVSRADVEGDSER